MEEGDAMELEAMTRFGIHRSHLSWVLVVFSTYFPSRMIDFVSNRIVNEPVSIKG